MRALFCIAACLFFAAGVGAAEDYARERSAMMSEIAAMATQTGSGAVGVRFDARVMEAMRNVPRHAFVPPDQVRYAYANRPLPIGYGQTISQPYIVALMTDLLAVKSGDKVLEIGTGSGYQAAILAELGAKAYSIEIVEALGKEAAERFRQLRTRNVETRVGDGYYGWDAHAPFDSIIVTAAANHVPPPLVRQLKTGGKMVIPVGSAFLTQHLMLIEKNADGSVSSRQILPVRFVPLTGVR